MSKTLALSHNGLITFQILYINVSFRFTYIFYFS